MNDTKTAAYIETDALNNWNLELNRINSDSIDLLNSYLTTTKDLKNYMAGNVADGFINDVSTLLENTKNNHIKMHSIEEFLTLVIDTMSNE